jgi:hypothetical protein
MRQTFTIAGSLALVSLFGIANAGYAQTVKSDAPASPAQQAVAVKAIPAKDGTFDVEITHNGRTRKFTGVKATPDGNFDLPALMELNPPAGIAGRKQRKVIKVEGKPLIFPSGAAAAQTQVQAQSKSISVQAIGNDSGTFDVEITENGKTRKVTGLKPGPKGRIEVPSGVKGHPPIIIDTTKGPNGIGTVRVEGKPLIFPSGAATAQAHSSSVSVNAVGNGSGTFDVEITENGKTRKLTGLTPGPKGFIEIPSGPNGTATIVIDPNAPHGGTNIKVEGKPLILPSGAATAQEQSRNVVVKATGSGSGTFDVEITENGKTRKLTGVTAGPDGSLDIPELNDVAPAGAKISKQIKIINVDGNQSGPALSTIIENNNTEDVKVFLSGAEVSGDVSKVIKSGAAITVTTDGNGSKSGRVLCIEPGAPGLPHPKQVYKVATTKKASKEILIVAKLVNGKKVVSEAKLVVLSGQTAKLDAGDVWLSLSATISPAGTISLKGDAGSAKSPKGPGFSVSGLASGGSFKYPNGASGTWEIKASVSGAAAKP